MLYLLSVAIHYLFAEAEASRAAQRRALEAEVAARDAELLALSGAYASLIHDQEGADVVA